MVAMIKIGQGTQRNFKRGVWMALTRADFDGTLKYNVYMNFQC